MRKLQYISELERSVTALQARIICNLYNFSFDDSNYAILQSEVSALSPRVAFLDHQRSILTMGNSHLKQRIAALAQDRIFKDGEYPAP